MSQPEIQRREAHSFGCAFALVGVELLEGRPCLVYLLSLVLGL